MKKRLKTVLVIVLICLLYFFVSIFLSPTNSFVRYNFQNINTQEEMLGKDDLLNNSPSIIEFNGEKVCEKLELWITKNKYWKQYGILPIGYYVYDNDKASLNINLPSEIFNSNIRIKFDYYPEMSKHSIQKRIYNLNDTVSVSIYDKNKKDTLCKFRVLIGNEEK